MAILDILVDLVELATPWSVAYADAPAEATETSEETSADIKEAEAAEEKPTEEPADEEPAEEEPVEEEPAEEVSEEEEEENEEEEQETVDPKDKFEAECRESKQCAPAKHHFEECVERVTNATSEGAATEDCVEEFFHLAHCSTQCAAPKLWSVLK